MFAFGLYLTVIFEMSSSSSWLGTWRWCTLSCLCPSNSPIPLPISQHLLQPGGVSFSFGYSRIFIGNSQKFVFEKKRKYVVNFELKVLSTTPGIILQRQCQVENVVIAKRYHSCFYWKKKKSIYP